VIVVDDDSDNPPRHCGLDSQSFELSGDCGFRRNDDGVEFIFAKDQKRCGAGYARNIGMEHAKGKWLVFADADDFFLPAFDEALNEYKNNDSDIVFFMASSVNADTLEPNKWNLTLNRLLAKAKRTQNYDLLIDVNVPWGKFFKRDFILKNDLHFQEVRYANDFLFAVKTAFYARTVSISEQSIYCYVIRPDSLHGRRTLKSLLVRFDVVCGGIKFLKPSGKEEYVIKDLDGAWYEILGMNKVVGACCMLKIIFRFGLSFAYKYYLKKLVKKI